jgi:hypothetical protein
MTASCMGGWNCPRRDNCARYHAEDRSIPTERLCEPGQSDAWQPLTKAEKPTQPETEAA